MPNDPILSFKRATIKLQNFYLQWSRQSSKKSIFLVQLEVPLKATKDNIFMWISLIADFLEIMIATKKWDIFNSKNCYRIKK